MRSAEEDTPRNASQQNQQQVKSSKDKNYCDVHCHHRTILKANFIHCCHPNQCSCSSKITQKPYEVHVPIQKSEWNNYENRELKMRAYPQSSDIVDGLLRYNSNLTKYLQKYNKTVSSQDENNHFQNNNEGNNYYHRPNTGNIIEDYKLNILPESQLPKKIESPKNSVQSPKSPKKQFNTISQQTSPKNTKKVNKKEHELTNKEKMQDYIQKDLRKSSRYLSNTGFRKYFNRQCFENYGRQNTNGVADGILYNGYLKTHNINPHSGGNLGQKEEVYHHALISADAEKISGQVGEEVAKKKELGRRRQQFMREAVSENPEKDLVQTGTLLEEQQKHHKQVDKYKHIVLKSPSPKSAMKQIQIKVAENTKNLERKYRPICEEQREQNRIKNLPQVQFKQNDEEIQKEEFVQERERIPPQPIEKQNRYERKMPNTKILINNNQTKTINKIDISQQEIMQNRALKKQIIEQCYYNPSIAHSIEKIQIHQAFPCRVCEERRFTHCCCIV